MHVKVITNNNGSILGRIPVRISEEPRPESNHIARNSANYTSPWPIDSSESWAGDSEQEEMAQTGHSSSQREYWSRGSSIRSLVKSFLKLEVQEDSADRGHNSGVEKQTFFPDPMISFLVDQPRGLTCQICRTTTLSIGASSNTPDEHTPAILPCGHLGCHDCLWSWVTSNKDCPFCRREMKHSGCGHILRPALITHETIANLPKTIPRGGTMGETCRDCRDRENKEKAFILWGLATNTVRMSRQARPDADRKKARQAEEVAQELFESVPREYLKNLDLEKNTW
ncbi:hypothetical protein F4811DRAFT_571410 [Daldinia bambusicola]|nr:hypothetical protein F4811DRAFT_571410 [Daldinia bambusicola]